MKNKFKYILLIIVLLFQTGCINNKSNTSSLKIVSTIFSGYDFAHAVTKNKADLTMLIKPGTEVHTYDPTPQDIIKIQNCDIFIYVGGENDEWVEDVLSSMDTSKIRIIRMMDYVNTYEEEVTSEMTVKEKKEKKELDEHVWTSINNAIKIINVIKNNVISIDKKNKSLYEKNTTDYINKLNSIDKEIKEVINTSKRKELIFGDRFPFRYFVEDYNLTYKAAYPGCSSETEVSINTMKKLTNEIKSKKIPVVLYLELSNKNIAESLAKETNAKTLMLNSAHNVTKKDFEKGITYADIYENNIKVLKEALN